LGPDGKIYISSLHEHDSLNSANYNLSVINDPNQVGLACNFTYASLNLKGRRTTYSLPNLPNFNLPPMVAQVAEAGPQTPMICPGDSVRIGYPDTTNGAVTYRWSPTIGIADSNAASTYVRPDTTRWYYLTALDTAMGLPCGQTIDSVLVTVVPSADIPVVSLGNDTTICPGDSVSLSVGAGSGWEYAWNTGDSTSSVSVNASAIYSVTVTNPAANLHCFSASDSIAVSHFPNPQPLPVDVAGGDTVICNGDSIRLGQSPVAGWNYLWSPSTFLNAANLPQPMAVPLSSLDYVLEARDSISGGACFTLGDTITLTVEQPFTHPAPEDIRFCIGECFEMGVAPVSGKTYQWSPITGLTSPTASLTKVLPIASVCPKSPLFSKSRAFWQLDFRHLGSGWHDFQLALVGLAWFLVDVLAFNFRFRAIGAHFSRRLDAVACFCVPHAALESVLGGACACFSLSRPSKMLPKRCRLQDSTPSAA